ncbi:potassium channel family protein [Haloarchaeobius amylolyticus]|uniref:potassium channel family protein n=1 Tax=Haloarchaeobius amylolyticus TaxID=1198296 RepID=UPI002270685F|nr:TrkA family potassium uptake protein [Haloarchaeobius amylolyticus]
MYVIVVGAGDIGWPLVDMATGAGHEVVVVDADEQTASEVAREFDCLAINDDATEADTLEEAGARRADAIISTAESDATNIMVMLLAEEYDVPSRVSVVHNTDHMSLFRRSGANVVENPQKLISEHLFRAVQRPSVSDWMHLADDAEVFEVRVDEEAPIAGRRLSEADESGLLAPDVLVVAIERDGGVVTPKGGTTIRAGDSVAVFSERGFADDVLETFGAEDQIATGHAGLL